MRIRSSATFAAALALPCGLLFAASTHALAHGPGSVAGSVRSAAPESLVEQVQRRRGPARARGRTGRNVGIGLGVLGAAILLNEAARAEGRRRYTRGSYCGRLLYQCENGSNWSCGKYEDRCL
jgi:hypothetical protein